METPPYGLRSIFPYVNDIVYLVTVSSKNRNSKGNFKTVG